MAILDILPTPQQATGTAETTTVSPTDVLMAGMTITPGVAGDYCAWFSAAVDHNLADASLFASLYVGGVQEAATLRPFRRGDAGADVGGTLAFHGICISVGVADAIEVRWCTTAATASAYGRTLTIWQVS